ncbi:MAG: hypothetical protein ACLPVO_07535 [Desulfomonilaceae bacterium]
MNEGIFQILGADTPPLLGRIKLINSLWNDLTNVTPSHVSVVGPRYIGKSVLLKALADRMSEEDSPYSSTIFWDLGHQTPQSDEEFLKMLCKQIGNGILEFNPDYGQHLLSTHASEYSEICEVLDALHEDGQKILMIWDGFDKPLSQGRLSRNLWDNLLELSRKPSLWLVTGSRKELHELIRDMNSVTSDFWGVFGKKLRVSVFDDDDIEVILSSIPDLVFDQGAKKGLVQWSEGIPVLLLRILDQLISNSEGRRQVTNEMVNQAAERASLDLRGQLNFMWDECPAGAQDLYALMTDRGEVLLSDTSIENRSCLIEKGLAKQSSNKLRATCRMLQEHISGQRPDAGTMERLFGNWDNYRSNIRGLLERRLAQIPSFFDDRLHRLVGRAIEDIPDYPDDCLNNLTTIEERAFDLIWQREFGPNKVIPPEIFSYWKQCVPSDKTLSRLLEQSGDRVPTDRFLQCGLLQLLTGSKSGIDSKALHASKDTYVLINAIHSFRNRNQHADGQQMHAGVGVAAITLCLELLSLLESELS